MRSTSNMRSRFQQSAGFGLGPGFPTLLSPGTELATVGTGTLRTLNQHMQRKHSSGIEQLEPATDLSQPGSHESATGLPTNPYSGSGQASCASHRSYWLPAASCQSLHEAVLWLVFLHTCESISRIPLRHVCRSNDGIHNNKQDDMGISRKNDSIK